MRARSLLIVMQKKNMDEEEDDGHFGFYGQQLRILKCDTHSMHATAMIL